jgi:cyclopropane fatty-acyl-phospholipid synthase-like methyltransferase
VNARFDLIVCAEVLYYLRAEDSKAVCQALDRLLEKRGVILTVSGIPNRDAPSSRSGYFNGWNEIFRCQFAGLPSIDFTETSRPYRIAGFARCDDRTT